MAQNATTAPKQMTAALVGLITHEQPNVKAQEYLEELTLLTYTLGIKTVATFKQKIDKPNPKTLLGKGKLAEIKDFVQKNQVDKVIFDEEVAPSQLRNLENILGCEVLDRNLVILNIFSMRAKTRQAKTQVELAQYEYLLPRLTRMWSHLSKQKGGSPGMRGPGEKELETDRRVVQDKILVLRKDLQTIDKQNINQRKTRNNIVRIALVGYTNVGKSTLMHALSKAEVVVEDKLFATIGSTVRRIMAKDIPCLLTDTVGFIRKLPHTLIECFKSTLDEVREADILLHVVDIAHPACEEHIQIVQKTLQELGAEDIPTILLFNKVDQLEEASQDPLQASPMSLWALQNRYINKYGQKVVFISAKHNQHIEALRDVLYEYVLAKHQLIYPNYLNKATY